MNFSIITCTYNPNKIIFKRLISSIEKMIVPEQSKIEWIIVDNNSPKPISELQYVNKFVWNNTYTKIIIEKKQGLTNARIAGIKASKYDWIIFFDDDNEPYPDYIQNLIPILVKDSRIACLGPGNINVEFIGEVSNNWVNSKKNIFQQKNIYEIEISNLKGWQNCYPIGTGLIAKKEVLNDYISKIENKKYTLTDRKGKSLISGGDTQIVLHAQKKGYYSGISPQIKLNHLILSKKANKKYIFKQKYWTGSSFIKCYNEVYYDTPVKLEFKSSFQIFVLICKQMYFWKLINKKSFVEAMFLTTKNLGEINARYIAADKKNPLILRLIENTLLK